MKNLNQVLILGAFFSGVVLSAPSVMAQQKMNTDTQDLVIKKMERVLSALEKGDSAYVASQQRLADLLSERARLRFMSEIEANCDGCKGSKDDRKKAIGIYETLLKEVKINEHGVILFQLAHLYEMAGQTDKAIALYEKIIKEAKSQKTAAAIVSRSRAGLGDLLFQTGKFNEALKQYETALKDKNLDNRALTIYNKAWCEFNTDRLNAAIKTMETLLKNPQGISRSTDGNSKYDPVFHADIQRDLATFYSRRAITDKEIATYDGLIPAGKRKELMLHFADEADRVGQKQAAHKILSRYLEDSELSKEERLAGLMKLAQVNYDRGQSTQSTSDFAKAAAAFQKAGCEGEEKCQELEKMMKRYVTELHRSKKVKPDQDLLNAYITYQNTFPNDIEMTERGATVASDIGNFAVATQLYRTISETKGFSEKDRQNALLNEISVAEKTKNPVIQKEAYLHFLKYSSDDKKNFEVRYQLAYLAYQQKQLAEAADAFNDLARQKDGNADLRLKSANLALDTLAQMKDDARIEVWAADYATMFPSSRKEFLALSHKALMNRAATVANSSDSSQRDLRKVLGQVSDSKNIGTTPQEQILFYTNQSVLAKKAGDDETYVSSLRSLLAISALSAGKREDTLSALAAHYEKKLDFKNAYIISTKMAQGKESAKDREFRLGTLADLAEMNPEKHYRASLKAGMTGSKALTLRARLVTLSKNPASELRAQASELKQKPALLNEMTIYVFAKTGSKNSVKSVLEMKEMRRQSAGLFIEKQDFYGKVSAFQNRIAALKLDTKTDRQLGKTMADRISALGQADKLLAESLRLKDVTSQMMMLTVMAQENERMVRDLAGLPMPKGLTPAEEKQYVSILKGKSKPFLMKARMAQQKQQEIWAQSPALAQLVKDYKSTRPEVQRLLAREMQILVQLPGSGKMKSEISGALSESSFSARELQSARKNVSENPENIRDLENLKFIETKIGHPLMPSYLDARLNTLQKGKSL